MNSEASNHQYPFRAQSRRTVWVEALAAVGALGPVCVLPLYAYSRISIEYNEFYKPDPGFEFGLGLVVLLATLAPLWLVAGYNSRYWFWKFRRFEVGDEGARIVKNYGSVTWSTDWAGITSLGYKWINRQQLGDLTQTTHELLFYDKYFEVSKKVVLHPRMTGLDETVDACLRYGRSRTVEYICEAVGQGATLAIDSNHTLAPSGLTIKRFMSESVVVRWQDMHSSETRSVRLAPSGEGLSGGAPGSRSNEVAINAMANTCLP